MERQNSTEEPLVQEALEQTIRTLGYALSGVNHIENTVHYAEHLAEALELSAEDIVALRWGVWLHDIGISRLPQELLNRKGVLSLEERKELQNHPQWGVDILQQMTFLPQGTLEVVLYHHETFDGRGYPRGLVGSETPLLARIAGLADVYASLISPRPFREAWTPEEATAYLQDRAGKQFDPTLVPIFVEVIRNHSCDIDHAAGVFSVL